MVNINELVRENVRRLKPYSCARDEFKGSDGVFMDANENPYGNLNRYPDPLQTELKTLVSDLRGVSVENIFLGNGSDEVIDLCYRIFCKPAIDKALLFTPTYGMYEVSASVNDIGIVKIPLDADFQIDMKRTKPMLTDKTLKLIFLCSPNNPTGNSMNLSDVEDLIASFKGIVVIDEAYIDFSTKPSFLPLIAKYPNLIVMQTFSKAFGLASVRVGMAFADQLIIHYFNKLKYPYNISTINQKAVIARLGKRDKTRAEVKRIISEKERLVNEFGRMSLITRIFPSDANFILVKVKDADSIYDILIGKGIVVRNRSSVADNCLRITIGTRAENNILINALKSIQV
jgi:histidinol-phosphate aminotransferase